LKEGEYDRSYIVAMHENSTMKQTHQKLFKRRGRWRGVKKE
jgi:hypothetical protein